MNHASFARHAIQLVAAILLPVALSVPAVAQDVRSDGGLKQGGRVLTVTTLASEGSGSLRAALSQTGPRVIVFAVGGAIKLKTDLTIEHGQVTIAGETAPSPGIILRDGTLKIRASDIVVSHIAVYPGSTQDPKVADARDGINIYGSPSRNQRIGNIVLRNVSVGWGIDENVGLQGLTDGVMIKNALIAQPLKYGGHPKGAHSMNLLLGNTVGRVIIVGSLFASSEQRSPRLTNGNRVSFLNNVVFGAGRLSSHLDRSQEILNAGAIDLIGNVYRPMRWTYCREPLIRIDKGFFQTSPVTAAHLKDNIVLSDVKGCVLPPETMVGLSQRALLTTPGWPIRPAASLYPGILAQVGSHPSKRSQLEQRVVDGVRDGTLPILANDSALLLDANWPEKRHVINPPTASGELRTSGAVTAMRTWLCARHSVVSGGARCPD